jgi:hypothetical protein
MQAMTAKVRSGEGSTNGREAIANVLSFISCRTHLCTAVLAATDLRIAPEGRT